MRQKIWQWYLVTSGGSSIRKGGKGDPEEGWFQKPTYPWFFLGGRGRQEGWVRPWFVALHKTTVEVDLLSPPTPPPGGPGPLTHGIPSDDTPAAQKFVFAFHAKIDVESPNEDHAPPPVTKSSVRPWNGMRTCIQCSLPFLLDTPYAS